MYIVQWIMDVDSRHWNNDKENKATAYVIFWIQYVVTNSCILCMILKYLRKEDIFSMPGTTVSL